MKQVRLKKTSVWLFLASLAVVLVLFVEHHAHFGIRLLQRQQQQQKRRNIDKKSIEPEENIEKAYQAYLSACMTLYRDLRTPNKSLLFNPPLRRLPPHMLDAFTQQGDMPITSYEYYNDIYSDATDKKQHQAAGNQQKQEPKVVYSSTFMDLLRRLVSSSVSFHYKDALKTYDYMRSHRQLFAGRTMVIVGTEYPWLEAVALETGATKVTTLDYTRKQYEQAAILDWQHINDYLDRTMRERTIEQFDNAASFSSIEHSGLGRYGDPLDADGDVRAVQQVHCMLRPNGVLLLGVPVSADQSSYIVFNAHRVYGAKRLQRLFSGWDVFFVGTRDFHQIFMLRKVSAY